MPLAVVVAVSTLLWPSWLGIMLSPANEGLGWNVSLIPWSIPVAVAVIGYLATTEGPQLLRERLSILIGPLVSPYLGLYSWWPALGALTSRPWLAWAMTAISWAAVFGRLSN